MSRDFVTWFIIYTVLLPPPPEAVAGAQGASRDSRTWTRAQRIENFRCSQRYKLNCIVGLYFNFKVTWLNRGCRYIVQYTLYNHVLQTIIENCKSFVMTYVGVKCLTRHCSCSTWHTNSWYNVEKIMVYMSKRLVQLTLQPVGLT